MLRLLNLPRDILVRLLLHHFTVQEVIQLRAICHELYNLVHYCLGRRRTLKLFFSFAEVQAYSQVLYEYNLESDSALRLHPPGPSSDELILDMYQFNNAVVDLLVDGLFPNVCHLIIFFGDRIHWKKCRADRVRFTYLLRYNITYLMERMQSRLTGLSLLGRIRSNDPGRSISRRLLHKINKIHNLTRLDICVVNFFICSDNKFDAHMDDHRIPLVQQNPDPPFHVLDSRLLHKLERISVHFDFEQNGPNFFRHSIRHLGANLTHLTMHHLHSDQNVYVPESLLCHSLIGPASQFAGSITHLKLTQHLSTLLPKVLPRFAQLKSLDLVNFKFSKAEIGMTLPELFDTLAQCSPQLSELKLFRFTLGWIRDDEIVANVPQLEQITSLVLRCVDEVSYFLPEIKPEDTKIPFDKFSTAFAHIFPNLEQCYLKTEPEFFVFSEGIEAKVALTAMQRLRTLSICFYYSIETRTFGSPDFTCHHLLSEPFRSRHIRECADRWEEFELTTHWTLYYKDFKGVWCEKWY